MFILSTLSTSSVEEVAEAAPEATRWFQLYIYKDRKVTEDLIRRVEKAGYKALVLTVDAPVFGKRRADVRHKFKLPAHLRLANFGCQEKSQGITSAESTSGLEEYTLKLFDQSICWKDVEWLKSFTSLPIVLKGVLTREDALMAVNLGVAAVQVSNHGARQLDGVPASVRTCYAMTTQNEDGAVEMTLLSSSQD